MSQPEKLIDFSTEDMGEGVKFAYGVSRTTHESVFGIMAEKDETRKAVDFYAIDDLSIEGSRLFTRTKKDGEVVGGDVTEGQDGGASESSRVASNEDIAIAMAEFLSAFIESVYNNRNLNLRIKIDPKIPLEIYERTLILLEKGCKIDSGSLNKKSGYLLLTYE